MRFYLIIGTIVAYFVFCGYIINDGIRSIRVNSFKIGCMNSGAPAEAIEQCKTLAEEKFNK
jgi:hypothetical protein